MRIEPARLLIRHRGRWIDINAPHREPVDGLPQPPPGTIMEVEATAGRTLLRRDAAGGWLVEAALLWSLLDPLRPRSCDPQQEPLAAVRRTWARLDWWASTPEQERLAVGSLLERCQHGAGAVCALLDRLAAAGDPHGAATGSGADVARVRTAAHGSALPDDPVAVAAFCRDPEGLGALYGERFAAREQQAELAAAVARALASHGPLLAEAGTGTGKTLAYLVPLVGRLAAGKGRAVVATYSRALQGQILDGDFPVLTAGRPDLSARLLMGRARYLCLRQRRAFLGRPVEDARQIAAAAAFRLWLLATEEGMRDELDDHPLLAAELRDLFSGVQPCLPACWEQPGCFVVRARRLAREAQLVVVNHALLLSDQASGGALIGPFEDLVIDEAHRLPQVMLDARSVRLDLHRLNDLEELVGTQRSGSPGPEAARLLAVLLGALADADAAVAAAEAFGKAAGRALQAYRHWWARVGEHLAPGQQAVAGQRLRIADKDVAFAPLAEATAGLHDALAAAAAAAARLGQRCEDLPRLGEDRVDLLARCAQAGLLFERLQTDVRFVTSDPGDRWVAWLEPGPRGAVRCLGATPLEAGPLLREVWSQDQRAPIATSATLAIGRDFGFMLEELGLSGRRPATATLAVSSPFDWRAQTLCLAVEGMPGPDQADYPQVLADILGDLRRRVPRQTLVLFTAYRLLQEVADRLAAERREQELFDEPQGAELLVQNAQAGAGDLRERFRRGRAAMLLGTSTFWEGVDFPGASLEILVVTKLPFLVPNDPWVQARCERLRAMGEDPFRDFMLRDAVLRLRQGVGRLLRRDTDRGVVLLLDNRLITRGYGATFLAAMPAPVRWLPDPGAITGTIREFFDPVRARPPA